MIPSLRNAVAAAIKSGTKRSDISVPEWALTYPPATEADVREEWAIALAKVAPNSAPDCVEGK